MPTAEQQAVLRALAEYYRGGGTDLNVARSARTEPDNNGRISGAPATNLPPAQDVPAWALHDASAPEGGGGAGTPDDIMAANAKQLQFNNLGSQPPEPEPDLSGFSAYPGPRQFPQIQAKVQKGQPVNSDDIRSTTSPTQALSPDQEEALNKQLNSKDDEDED